MPQTSHVAEVHRDVRQLRHEQHAMRDAIWGLQHDVTRVDEAVKGLRTVVDYALQKQARAQRLLVWLSALCTVLLASLVVVFLLRVYRMIGP